MAGRPRILPDGPSRQNDRHGRTARWLTTIPERATELRLIYVDSDGQDTVLQSWLKETVTPEETPKLIDDLIRDHTNEQAVTCKGRVVWIDKDEKPITSRNWKQYPEEGEDRFSGDMQSLITQQQRHIEALLQYNVRSQSMVLEQMVKIVEMVTAKYEDAEGVTDLKDEQIELLRDELRQMKDQQNEQSDPHMERVIGLLEQSITKGLAKRPNGQG